MNPSARISTLCLLAFAIGAAAGWLGRGALLKSRSDSTTPAPAQTATTGAALPVEAAVVSANSARANVVPAATRAVATPRDAATERLKALVWFKNNGLEYLNLPVFGADGLSPGFIQAFALSPAETATLNEAIRRARSEIVEMARAGATVNVDAGKGLITVDVPSIPVRGGQVHDQLLEQFRNVLGADRFEQFDAVAGTTFESGLDSFGAEGSKYELTTRTDQAGRTMFDVKRSFSMPNSSGWSNSTVVPEDLAKTFPVLAGVVPSASKPVPAPKN